MREELEELVRRAQGGDKASLERVVRRIQDRVYRLALRMLVSPDDALEATQEILILVVTKLSTFRGDSAFETWVYRVAVNALLGLERSRQRQLDFKAFGADLIEGLADDPAEEDRVMLNELRVSCTMAMLLCLSPGHRLAYVLGDVLELDHQQGAEAMGLTPANFRKRLSRARKDVVAFTSRMCGVTRDGARCSCTRRLPSAIDKGRVRPGVVVYSGPDGPSYAEAVERARAVEGALSVLKAQQAMPAFRCPRDLAADVARIVEAT